MNCGHWSHGKNVVVVWRQLENPEEIGAKVQEGT